MSHRIIVFIALFSLSLAAAACSSKKPVAAPEPPVAAPTPQPPAEPPASAEPARTETATGPLRDALIALHRVHFPYDSATLSQEARENLAEAAKQLADHKDVHLYVDGHSDERGTAEYNIGLGDRRGNVVADYLARMGISRDRLHVVSYGEERPLASGSGVRAWAKNRRVEFRLMRGDVKLEIEEGALLDDSGEPLAPVGGSQAAN